MRNVTYINAGAGSGKTYRLTETLTKLIKEKKVRPEQVILTTFTTKAANEFKEKAKACLFDEGMYEEAVQLDHAMIGTIHSVCQRMICKYWFNLGLSSNMGVMAEEDTKYYISQSLAELPTEEELKVLHDFARDFDVRIHENYRPKGIDYDFWQGHLKNIIDFATNYELEDFAKSEEESQSFIRQFVMHGSNCDFTYNELKAIVDEHEAFLRSKKQSNANDERIDKLVQAKRFLHRPTLGTLKDIKSTIGTPKGYGPLAENFADRMANVWTSKAVYDKQEGYIKLLFNLAKRWKENFAQFKRDKNLLDYNDMEKYMRQLMQDDTIASEISQSYRYLFVDEFQDSSPIQVKIFDALSDLMEHSYWVGDYKQAIYGFRGSDIALTKAVVDRVAKKENGCDTDTLDKSWRSLPDIVEVNNAIFEKTFADVLDNENIHLDKVRENKTHEDSLRYFVTGEGAGVAEHILKLLNKGAKPNEIAVLARTNDELITVADNLRRWYVPSSREDYPIIKSPVYLLVASLLRIVGSAKDSLSKATVAILTESSCTTQQIIEAKILNEADTSAKTEDYLADVPLISQLLTIRPRLQQQSVASLVESMVIELNLYDVVKKLCIEPAFGISCLQAIIDKSRVYEEHSVRMNLPATIDGFLAYIEEVSPVCSGDPNGVQLHTYHSCKGLQWKYVILMSLNTNVANLKKAVKNQMYGVHAIHSEVPSADNPYPEVFIRLTPWIYGTGKNVPNEISVKIEESESFMLAYKSMIAETNRILYVGMTRPQDVLILNIDVPGSGQKLLQWPKDSGIDTVADSIPDFGAWDVFGTGHPFKDFTLTQAEMENLEAYGEHDEEIAMPLNIDEPSFEKREPRFLSPSRIHAKGDVASHHSFDKRIPFANEPSNMATVGDCIHQIFAGIEESRPAHKIELDEIIKSYGLKGVLDDKDAIALAWKNLADYLTATHGASVKTYHERPFRLERDGQTIVGSIDIVWQTEEGDILVDFKTCPMGAKAILNADSEHYAGWYAGQLDAYQDALEAAGEKVIKRYIYYPVSGLLAEVTRAFEIDPPYKKSVFHIFGVSGLDIEQLWKKATEHCSDDGFSGEIGIKELEENDETCQKYSTILQGASTQGVFVTYFPGDKAHLHIDLPWLGSIGDVRLAFAFMKSLRDIYPECEIYYNDTCDEGQFSMLGENIDAMIVMRLRNMMELIESSKNGQHAGVRGVFHDFIVPSIEDNPEKSIEELTMQAANDFITLQWEYSDYEDAGNAKVTVSDGEEYTMRILTNKYNTFVPVCQHVSISNKKGQVKDIQTKDFIKAMEGHPHFKMVDQMQFVLDQMSEEEWEEMYNSIDGIELGGNEPNKDNSLTLGVSLEQFNEFLSRKKDHVDVEIRQNNCLSVLENIDGNLVLCCDEMPTMFFGCHFWNNGEFPYVIKQSLKYLTLINQGRELNLKIIGHEKSVTERCDFKLDKCLKTNPNGDACIWNIRFNVEVYTYGGIPEDKNNNEDEAEHNVFLLRWNPAISSMTLDRYHNEIENDWESKVFDWSIYDWEDAHMGDLFFMIREGEDESAGIVFRGVFDSEPYIDEDWKDTTRQRHYCLYYIADQPSAVDGKPYISMEQLEKYLPEIDWRKGHSGEKISKEQARKLLKLWDGEDPDESHYTEKIPGKDNDEFDPEQGHGSHLQCIDDDLDSVIQSVFDVVGKSKDVIGGPKVTEKNESQEYEAQLMMLSTDESQDITLRSIIEVKDNGNELRCFYPYVVNNQPVTLTLKKIDEFSNGIEAVLTCEYNGNTFRFFDIDYPIHKEEYVIEETYQFALSAIAYHVEQVPESDMSFEIDSETVEKMHEADPSIVDRDKDGNALPMKMSMEMFVACLQHDGKHPDDAEFWSSVQSRVRKATLLKHDFYRMEITIYHDEYEEHVLSIPIAAKTSFFETKPTKGTSIRGYLWLQGRMKKD